MSDKQTILVLCTGNSCRSQMAEGLLRKFKGERYRIESAGTDPKPEIHPLAIRAMQEIGIDISGQRPKNASEFLGKGPIQHVLIVCDNANGTCPTAWPGAMSRTFMPFDDPAHAKGTEQEVLAVFRRVRDEIAVFAKTWEPQPKPTKNLHRR
jgi:arsenate reductase